MTIKVKRTNADENTLLKDCIFCHKEVKIEGITDDQIERLEKGEELIQDIMPEVSPGEREVLISGVCNECFDSL